MSAEYFREFLRDLSFAADAAAADPSRGKIDALQAKIAELAKFEKDGRLAFFWYPIVPTSRYGWGKPPHEAINRAIEASHDRIALVLDDCAALIDFFSTIRRDPPASAETDDGRPYWQNVLLPAI